MHATHMLVRKPMLTPNKSLPQWPFRHELLLLSLSRHRFDATLMLFRIRHRSITNPRSALVVMVSCIHPIAVARAIASQHVVKLIPLDCPEVIRLTLFVPLQLRIWKSEPKKFSLRHGLIDKSLPQFVIGE